MRLWPLLIYVLLQCVDRLQTSESDVYIQAILDQYQVNGVQIYYMYIQGLSRCPNKVVPHGTLEAINHDFL